MLKRVALLGFLAMLTVANAPGSANAWDGCGYRGCYPRYNYYPRNYAGCYRPYYYSRYYPRCRWCGGYAGYGYPGRGYARYGDGYDSYDGYYRRYNSYRYDDWDRYGS
jgi:hypothetical protein